VILFWAAKLRKTKSQNTLTRFVSLKEGQM
jgi:hypothetical protein